MIPTYFVPLFNQWSTLIGVAALIAVIINVLKATTVVKEGDAVKWSAGLNLVGLLTLFLLKVWKPDLSIELLDGAAADVALMLTIVLTYVTQLGISKLTHIAVKQVPIIGTSFPK